MGEKINVRTHEEQALSMADAILWRSKEILGSVDNCLRLDKSPELKDYFNEFDLKTLTRSLESVSYKLNHFGSYTLSELRQAQIDTYMLSQLETVLEELIEHKKSPGERIRSRIKNVFNSKY